jgi:hypothetical protein
VKFDISIEIGQGKEEKKIEHITTLRARLA